MKKLILLLAMFALVIFGFIQMLGAPSKTNSIASAVTITIVTNPIPDIQSYSDLGIIVATYDCAYKHERAPYMFLGKMYVTEPMFYDGFTVSFTNQIPGFIKKGLSVRTRALPPTATTGVPVPDNSRFDFLKNPPMPEPIDRPSPLPTNP